MASSPDPVQDSPFRALILILLISILSMVLCSCAAPTGSETHARNDSQDIQEPLARLAEGLLLEGGEIMSPLALGDILLAGKRCDLGREVKAHLPAVFEEVNPDLDIITQDHLDSG
ncbi:MAG: hypothetical protein ACYTG7_25140 [Planctomycetota bacterium]